MKTKGICDQHDCGSHDDHPLCSIMVALEGGDAVGKATQSKRLAARLRGSLFSFPNYETKTGKAILGSIRGEWCTTSYDGTRNDEINPLVRQSLYVANRYEAAANIRAANAIGPVVFDRYALSATVFGVTDGLDEEWLWRVQEALPQPHIHILLDLPVDEAVRRRPEMRDLYESNLPFREKVRENYLRIFRDSGPKRRMTASHRLGGQARMAGNMHVQFVVVDASGTPDEVHARIWDAVCSAAGVQ